MTASYVFVLACGSLAVLYGIFVTRSVLATSAGTEDMRRIAEAVQEGAAAYLRRQYVTIAAVGAVIGGFLGWRLGAPVAYGFLIGAVLSGCGVHRYEYLSACECPNR